MAIECISRKHEITYSIYRRLEFASANFNNYGADSSYFPIAKKFHSIENILKLKRLDKKLIDSEIECEERRNNSCRILSPGYRQIVFEWPPNWTNSVRIWNLSIKNVSCANFWQSIDFATKSVKKVEKDAADFWISLMRWWVDKFTLKQSRVV